MKKQQMKQAIIITLFSFCIILCSYITRAQSQNTTVNQRQFLTGNWDGARDSLAKNGISFRPRVTMFYQGTDRDAAEFSGKAELLAIFNGRKIGLPKWTLVAQLDQNFGNSINGSGGVLMPQNMPNFLPGME